MQQSRLAMEAWVNLAVDSSVRITSCGPNSAASREKYAHHVDPACVLREPVLIAGIS
jgi:hypothetical protein